MPALYLHIGHNKTGSTFIQTVFSNNRSRLAKLKISYPKCGADLRDIDLDRMTPTGNGSSLFSSKSTFNDIVTSSCHSDTNRLLFSSEVLFDQFSVCPDLVFVKNWSEQCGIDRVYILLFIRDPIDHALSFWQQRVKGWQCETRPIDEYIKLSYDFPIQVADVVQKIEHAGLKYNIFHYREQKTNIIKPFKRLLHIPDHFEFTIPKDIPVNRSLTAGEVELQRSINKHTQKSGRIFAFYMSNKFSDAPKHRMTPSRSAQENALMRLRPAIQFVNARMSLSQGYHEDIIYEQPPQDVHFTVEQIQLIGERIGRALVADDRVSFRRRATVTGRWSRLAARVRRRLGNIRKRVRAC